MIAQIRHVFGPALDIKRVVFLLCKSMRKQIKEYGLTNAYKTDDEAKNWCGMLDALVFLPVNTIPQGL